MGVLAPSLHRESTDSVSDIYNMYVPACTICNLMTADITKKQKAQQNVIPHYIVQEENQFLVLSSYF